jgi:hypothetical protein
MKNNINISEHKEKILIFFLFLFSLLINQYYGNKGIFPLDSFAYFDTGFRILLGEYPFKDYWIIHGPFIDYFQSFFFYIFGTNWQSYVLHASFVNVLLALTTFIVLKNFKLNIYFCFVYSLFVSVLAYPSSGTPFADHHSAFFSLLGVYFLILAISNEHKLYWILLPVFFCFAFLSKQVPSFYIIMSTVVILTLYSLINKKFYWIKYSLSSLVLFVIFLMIMGRVQGISFSSFIDQYILYPQTLGAERYNDIDISVKNILYRFKFIYIVALPLLYINLKKIFFEKNYLKEKDFLNFLILFFLTFSLILHQILTKNQIFIFFLIPILTAFTHINLIKYKQAPKFIIILIFTVCLFATFKYHIRFNEDRKFHELNNVNFHSAVPAKDIDKKFSGLKWITPEYKNNPEKEIISILEVKSYLENDKRKKMIMTHYSFFSIILDQKLFYPTRFITSHGVSFPVKGNKYFHKYQDFFIKKITENNIEVIYTIKPVDSYFPKELLGEKCIKSSSINSILAAHLILECDNLKSN